MRVKGAVTALALAMVAGMSAVTRAEVVASPVRALELMTEARVAGEKCGYLSAAERRELTDYAARVELVAVRRVGAAAVRRALLQGRQQGLAGCSEEKREKVLAVLEGARRAARGVPAVVPGRAGRVDEVAVRHSQAARPPRTEARAAVAHGRPGPVRRYVALATAYYHALKCRNRPQPELMRMWRSVRDMHYRLVRTVGGAAVARAKRIAERRGNARPCR